jgi:RNA polymerase sigma-70 factor (ECF subfamily)
LKPAENMPEHSLLASPVGFLGQSAPLVRSLHARANCVRWGLSDKDFGESLRRSAEKRFGDSRCSPQELEDYLKSLHLEDLALACACSLGIEPAWEFFMAHFRQDLRSAASAMLRASGCADDARAGELADSLHAELYGVRTDRDGRRKSLFEYFHGRSKLSTWLRAVLAQRQVDLLRMTSKMVPLGTEQDEEAPTGMRASTASVPVDPHREIYLKRFDRALSAALASLAPRERMILACYYVDGLRLAEIGRMLDEHESTVSRQLERVRQGLRDSVTRALQQEIAASNGRGAEPALDAAQIELAFKYAQEDWPFDLSQALSSAAQAAKKPPEE